MCVKGGGNRWAGFGRWRCGRDVSHQAVLKKMGKNPLSQSLFMNISKTIVDRMFHFLVTQKSRMQCNKHVAMNLEQQPFSAKGKHTLRGVEFISDGSMPRGPGAFGARIPDGAEQGSH